MEKKVTSPALKGFIISLILIVFSLIIQFLNLSKNKGLSSIQFIILFGGIVWSATSFAKQMRGNVTFGDVFVHGFKTAAAVTAITVIFTIISIKFISPEIINQAMVDARAQMEAKNVSDDQIDTNINLAKKFFVPMTAGILILFFLITGVIAALIGAAVSKKNPEQGPFVQQG
jgi:hypothetical protein